MQEFDYKVVRSIEQIEKTKHYELVKELCANFSDDHKLYITSVFTLSCAIALVDGTIYLSEVEAIHRVLPKDLELTESMRKSIVELNLSYSILENGFSTTLPHFCQYLKSKMSPENKEKLIILLYQLAYADNNLAKLEDELINRIGKLINLNEDLLNRCKEKVAKGHKIRINDTEIFYLKRVKTLNEKPIHNKEFHQISVDRFKVQSESFQKNPSFYYIKRMCKDIPELDIYFITAYLGLAFGIITEDKEIHKKEIDYIMHELSQWFNFDEKSLQMLMDLHVYNYRYKKDLNQFIDDYTFILSQLFRSNDKLDYIHVLMNLSTTDEDISPLEIELIDRVVKIFHIEVERLNEIKAKALGIEGSSEVIDSKQTWEDGSIDLENLE